MLASLAQVEGDPSDDVIVQLPTPVTSADAVYLLRELCAFAASTWNFASSTVDKGQRVAGRNVAFL
jgi:hypothetical protein